MRLKRGEVGRRGGGVAVHVDGGAVVMWVQGGAGKREVDGRGAGS